MSPDLSEAEHVALVELLTEAVHGTNYELAPRPKRFTSILLKLKPEAARAPDSHVNRLIAAR